MADRVLGGRYQIQDKIGTGGMAIVYRGLDQVLGRTVAIKTMLPQYANDSSFAARFKQEAQAAAALQSPYIVSVYDWGKDGDTYFIVMEYLRGTDLKSGIRKHGALDCRKVAQIGTQICQALSVAHAHDIIHRDIKPQNIMVQPDGNIKVMDFGIARAKNSHLTADNSVLGTAHYVSPEQTQGRELGPTSDLYSLGIVMYEAATGKVPFDGDDAISVALKQVNELPLPPSRLNPKVDPALEAIILKCMQKNPAARFQTADELQQVLREYVKGNYAAVSGATATTVLPAGPTQQIASPTQQLANPNAGAPVQPGMGNTASRPIPVGNMNARPRGDRATEQAMREAEMRRQEEKDKRRRTGIIAGVVIALIAAAAIAGFLIFGRGGSDTQRVPNLVGLPEEDAIATIDATDFFELGEVTHEYSDSVAEGRVISQNPKPNRSAEEGTEIDLVVSKGEEPAEKVEVPDLSNMTPEQAEAALTQLGLKATRGDDVTDDEVQEGRVASQDPAPHATAAEGDTVTYHVSKGSGKVEVPSVVGKSKGDASAALEAAGFVVHIEYDHSDSVPEGQVISQSPSGGEKLGKGEQVTIVVSQGKGTATVPGAQGKSKDDAISAIEAAGFVASVSYDYSDSVPAGDVISQSPAAGSEAESGSTITIVVSQGPAVTYVTVPNCVGNDVTSAQSDLAAVDLYTNVTYVADSAPFGYVISQSPSSGEQVEEGSAVTLTVSDGTG